MEAKPNFSSLKAMYVNCTLKDSSKKSHIEGLMKVSMDILKSENVEVDYLRLQDYEIVVGLQPDMTEGGTEEDDWPAIYERIIHADIFVMGTPIWQGEKSSVATKLVERLYGMSGKPIRKDNIFTTGKWVVV